MQNYANKASFENFIPSKILYLTLKVSEILTAEQFEHVFWLASFVWLNWSTRVGVKAVSLHSLIYDVIKEFSSLTRFLLLVAYAAIITPADIRRESICLAFDFAVPLPNFYNLHNGFENLKILFHLLKYHLRSSPPVKTRPALTVHKFHDFRDVAVGRRNPSKKHVHVYARSVLFKNNIK